MLEDPMLKSTFNSWTQGLLESFLHKFAMTGVNKCREPRIFTFCSGCTVWENDIDILLWQHAMISFFLLNF